MTALTKTTIKKLYAAEPTIKIYNGNFCRASVKIENNKRQYEIGVDLSHPFLEQYSGKIYHVEFIMWHGYSGYNEVIPPELDDLVQKLRIAAIIPDEKAQELADEMREAVINFYKAMF